MANHNEKPFLDQPKLNTSGFARELPACGRPIQLGYRAGSDLPEAAPLLPGQPDELWLAWPGDLANSDGKDDLPIIRVDTTGGAWWALGAFRPPAEVVQNARLALDAYAEYLRERSDLGTPIGRIVRSPATELPLTLPGELSEVPKVRDDPVHLFETWLDARLPGRGNEEKVVADALLGRKDWRQSFRKSSEVTQSARIQFDKPTLSPTFQQPRSFVRYQQYFHEYPVLGGQLSSQLVQDERTILCNSTYLPIPDNALDYAEGRDLLCKNQAALVAARAVGHMLTLNTAERGGQEMEALAGEDSLGHNDLDIPSADKDWVIGIRFHDESPRCLVPYRTDERAYHLAYEVRLTEPDFGGTWSVFVEAVDGQVLDLPRLLTHFAPVYKSSAEIVAGDPPSLVLASNTNPSNAFMDVEKFSAIPASRVVDWSSNTVGGADFEAIQVGFHAQRVYKALRDAGVADADMQTPAKRLLAVVSTRGKNPPALEMGFDPGRTPPTITFQRDSDHGLDSFNKKVFNPAHDPEVIYHEVFHGLSWMLNPDPFENLIGTAPFARALAEGVAIYFARSIAQQHTQDAEAGWAIAAYPSANWSTQWALERNQSVLGSDFLPFANLYPDASVKTGSELDIYDVGMIWARTLWDLRRLLVPREVDVLALRSFLAARGWVTSFEALAEAVLYELNSDPPLQAAVTRLLQTRGIIAAANVRALYADGAVVLAGGDNEGLASADGGATWQALLLPGVVDLAATATHLVALTEEGVYQCPSGTVQPWTRLGGLAPPGLAGSTLGRPLSLAATSTGDLYLGTGAGIYSTPANSPLQWTPVPMTAANLLNGLPLAMTLVRPAGGGESHLVAAGFRAVWVRPLPINPAADWKQIELSDRSRDLVVCIASRDAAIYAGTCRSGIWQGTPNASGSFKPLQIATPADLGNGAVLCLAVRLQPAFALVAGTTAGLFAGAPSNAGAWTWQAVPGLPAGAFPRALAAQTGALFVGTAHHGLWRQDAAGTWSPVVGLQALVAQPAIIDLLQSAVLRETTPGVQTHFRPFQVTQERPLQVTAAPVAGAQAPTLSVRRLAPGLPVIPMSAANPATSLDPLVIGSYVLIISGSDDFDVTLSIA